ncbi:hypothetical protein ACFLUJ_08735 [Chloroflexota bacterium]
MNEDEIANQEGPKASLTQQADSEMEEIATQRARDRAGAARWDLNTAIFLFAVLILVIILVTYTKMGIETVAPVAVFGLVMVWLVGWRRSKNLYQRYLNEELARLKRASRKIPEEDVDKKVEETIEEKVQKALRERLR